MMTDFVGMGALNDEAAAFRRYQQVRALSPKTVRRRAVTLRQFAAWIVPLPLIGASADLIEEWLGTFTSPARCGALQRVDGAAVRLDGPVGRAGHVVIGRGAGGMQRGRAADRCRRSTRWVPRKQAGSRCVRDQSCVVSRRCRRAVRQLP